MGSQRQIQTLRMRHLQHGRHRIDETPPGNATWSTHRPLGKWRYLQSIGHVISHACWGPTLFVLCASCDCDFSASALDRIGRGGGCVLALLAACWFSRCCVAFISPLSLEHVLLCFSHVYPANHESPPYGPFPLSHGQFTFQARGARCITALPKKYEVSPTYDTAVQNDS